MSPSLGPSPFKLLLASDDSVIPTQKAPESTSAAKTIRAWPDVKRAYPVEGDCKTI